MIAHATLKHAAYWRVTGKRGGQTTVETVLARSARSAAAHYERYTVDEFETIALAVELLRFDRGVER